MKQVASEHSGPQRGMTAFMTLYATAIGQRREQALGAQAAIRVDPARMA